MGQPSDDYQALDARLTRYIEEHPDEVEWSTERTYLECATRGHPPYGCPHPGAGWPYWEICLCGEEAYS